MIKEQIEAAFNPSFSLLELTAKNPSLAAMMMWRYDDWQGAGEYGDYIHLGCGDHVLKGFVNLDFVPYSSEVYACNLLDIWPGRLTGKLKAFHAEDVMEHFFLPEQLYILASINLLLQQGGLVRVLMPDIAQLWTYAQNFEVARHVNSGDYFADVMRCRSGIDAVNMGMRMGGHRWLHSFDSYRRVAELCGFSAEHTSCATSTDTKLSGINIRDESGISFATELRKTRPLHRRIITSKCVVGAEFVEDLGQGQLLYRATTDDPAVMYAFDTLAVEDIAVMCIRNANVSEFKEHNFAKAYFRLEESGAIYIDRTLQSVPHANIYSQIDISTAMKGIPNLADVRFDPTDRPGDYFTTGPLELFYYASDDDKQKSPKRRPEHCAPDPNLPKSLADHVVTAETRVGLMAHFDFDGPIGLALDIYGEWAELEINSLLPFIPLGGQVVDVGANVGYHTLAFARKVGEQGMVLSIEPQEEVFALLRYNITINGLHGRVHPIQVAVSKENSIGQIPRITNTEGQNLGAVAPVVVADALCTSVGSLAEIKVVPIDELKLTGLDLLKIDAEGTEADVLQGAENTIRKYRPVIAMECGSFSSSWPALRAAFSMGYAVYHIRHAAFNFANYRENKNDVFAGAEEGTLLLLPHEKLPDRSFPSPPSQADQILAPLGFILSILSTKAYGSTIERLEVEALKCMLADFRRKRAEERCVAANTLAARRHKAVMELRETVSVISESGAHIDPLTIQRVLESTAPIPPDPFEPNLKASWPTVPDLKNWGVKKSLNGTTSHPLVDIVIPCYKDYQVTLACLHSVLSSQNNTACEIVVIDDASPEPQLKQALQELAEKELITLLKHPENLGFIVSANEGMALHTDRHTLLLNSDTIVFHGWLDRLIRHLHADETCGTVTPLSNNATICSYPVTERDNQAPLEISFPELDALTGHINRGKSIPIPTGVGFCMLIRRACVEQIGLFDEALFGKGYGEENDFCMRAASRGWKHLLAADVFVRHAGEKSFGKEALRFKESAFEKISRLHPSYLPIVERHCVEDPARRIRRNLDLARLRIVLGSSSKPVLLVGHNRGGGIERHLKEAAAHFVAIGSPVITLRPHSQKSVCVVALNVPQQLHLPNLVFDLSTEFGELLETLGCDLKIGNIHVHSFVDQHPEIPRLLALAARLLKVPYIFTVHDYLPICPKVNMLDENYLPCSGSELWRCQACMDKDSLTTGRIEIAKWREAYATFMAGADRIIAPSEDTAHRIVLEYPGCMEKVIIAPHPETIIPVTPIQSQSRREGEPLRVAIIGAIGPHKGSLILESCAADSQKRNLPLQFLVVGYTDRDESLQAHGVIITGRYKDEDIFGLLSSLGCHVAFLPSPWPETYCYTLSLACLAGLYPVVFDHGAPAERIAKWRFGYRLPINLLQNYAEINNRLLTINLLPQPDDLVERIVKAGERTFERLLDYQVLSPVQQQPPDGDKNG
jgi:FkbM family methyltransferase